MATRKTARQTTKGSAKGIPKPTRIAEPLAVNPITHLPGYLPEQETKGAIDNHGMFEDAANNKLSVDDAVKIYNDMIKKEVNVSAAPTEYDYNNDHIQELENNVDQDFYLDYMKLLNGYNQQSAIEQMRFQEYMSNTSHQRETKDLIAAGLNPVLSANNGASTPNGAYATVDSTPVGAKLAMKQQEAQIKANKEIVKSELAQSEKNLKAQMKAQKQMNKYSTDMSYKLGKYASDQNLAGSIYGANASAAASRYGADQAYLASVYGANTSLTNSREQRAWDNLHPSNGWQAGGSVISTVIDAFNGRNPANPTTNPNHQNSTAK